MAVIVQHCLEFSPLNNPSATIASPIAYLFVNDFNFGRFGVILFFFISGFLIPSSIANQPKPLVSFAIGRLFRLYPLYWFSVVLAIAVMAVLGMKLPSLAMVLANTTMFQLLLGFENILYPYWTLLIEHFFYILCALLFVVGALHSALRMQYVAALAAGGIILLSCVLIALPAIKYAKPAADLMYTASFLFAMIVGHNIRMAQGSDQRQARVLIAAAFVVVFAFIFVARVRVGGYSLLLSPASVFFSTVGALAVFLLALRWRAFTSAAFVYLGRVSYGLYLFHGIALWVAMALIGKSGGTLHFALLILLVFGLALATSALTFNLVEEPFIALGKLIRRRVVRNAGHKAPVAALFPSPAEVTQEDALQPFSKEAT
ncbi:acyltransferase [Bradyrhizobium sp. 1]|nr:acyltransferase [Bradyrhizobium sp. 1]